MQIQMSTSSSAAHIILPYFEQADGLQLPELYGGEAIPKKLFTGEVGAIRHLPQGDRLFLLVGLGPKEKANFEEMKGSFRKITAKQSDFFREPVTLYLDGSHTEESLQAAALGLWMGTYRLDFYKKPKADQVDFSQVSLELVAPELQQAAEILQQSAAIWKGQKRCLTLVDQPAHQVTPAFMAETVQQLGQDYGFEVRVFDAEQAREIGLEAFLAVGQGSARPPAFIIADYVHPDARIHVGLVGKGVTFDTGGYNIKTAGMHHMKCDMGGAAAVIGALEAAAAAALPIRLTTILPCVENAIGPSAFLPSDVIGSYSGKTIEVIDTDAEGRLILADGLYYMQKHFQPELLIDLATLTGSSVGTFGYACAALFSTDKTLENSLMEAGMSVGERVWPLPLWDLYGKEMESDMADIKNYHGKPFAGAITAAKFLQAFTEGHEKWAHLDIAGTAFGDSAFAKSKHATGFGVHLLFNLLQNHVDHGK
ncbi:leucyl aminopeptidase [Nitritalea halalkaliphila LW7]|uniref:Leucyl aminopeptidase n=1 Tax=Nitritalea halalkaliphila LW7 TaxID=1189621 RepID=I5C8F3_9BACT|nr:leucyl aminopeptidase family protein [Nitritalea halalkaliphila]EIM78105.1 leucyl aminopeptidase [Nitritalea halalkaliphila LW7]